MSDTSDTQDRPTSGLQDLVLRAAFVPEGEQPPPEFASDFRPLRFPATFDPETGTITCTNAGIGFGGDILAQWVPDAEQDEDEAGKTGG